MGVTVSAKADEALVRITAVSPSGAEMGSDRAIRNVAQTDRGIGRNTQQSATPKTTAFLAKEFSRLNITGL